MITTHEREKLINAIIFFEKNTRYLGKVKLFKLLYFLDFEHFQQIGRSVTGLDYYAWKMGPVPRELNDEVDSPNPDMSESLAFEKNGIGNGWKMSITPLKDFDETHFTKRELRILNELAAEYCDTKADDIIEATHLENLPWHEVYEKQGKQQALIPYEYALRKGEAEEMARLITEHEAILNHFSK